MEEKSPIFKADEVFWSVDCYLFPLRCFCFGFSFLWIMWKKEHKYAMVDLDCNWNNSNSCKYNSDFNWVLFKRIKIFIRYTYTNVQVYCYSNNQKNHQCLPVVLLGLGYYLDLEECGFGLLCVAALGIFAAMSPVMKKLKLLCLKKDTRENNVATTSNA